jgi:hypothetical protein
VQGQTDGRPKLVAKGTLLIRILAPAARQVPASGARRWKWVTKLTIVRESVSFRPPQNRNTSPVLNRAGVPPLGDTVGALMRSAENLHAKNGAIGKSTPPPKS